MSEGAEVYIRNLTVALTGNRQAWFPRDKEKRREMNIRLGHEFGYGLGIYDDWVGYAQETYGRFVVRNSFDSTGVVIDAKDWMDAIREGVEKYKASNA